MVDTGAAEVNTSASGDGVTWNQNRPGQPSTTTNKDNTARLTPERMKQLGLPEGIDLRNTDV